MVDPKNLSEGPSNYSARRYLSPMYVSELKVEEQGVKGIYRTGPDFMLGVWEAGTSPVAEPKFS